MTRRGRKSPQAHPSPDPEDAGLSLSGSAAVPPPDEESHWARAPRASIAAAVFPPAAAAILGLAESVSLGFYADDWRIIPGPLSQFKPFSLQLLEFLAEADRSRPALVPVRFLITSLLLDSPFLWHLMLACANALIALGIAGLLRTLSGESPGKNRLAWAGLGFLWVLLPWTCGARFWPVLLPVLFELASFVWMCAWLLSRWMAGKSPALVPFSCYLILTLSYEAFYFQFAPLALIGIALAVDGRVRLVHVLRSSAALLLAQAAAAGFRLLLMRLGTDQRSVMPDWPQRLAENSKALLPELARSFSMPAWLPLLMGTAVAVSVFFALRQRSPAIVARRRGFGSVVLLGSAFASGALLSVVSFTLGGRYWQGMGIESRSTVFFSLWLICAAGLSLGRALSRASGRSGTALAASLLGFQMLLFAGTVGRLEDWRKAEQKQRFVLDHFPVDSMAAALPRAVVLGIWEPDVNGVPVIGYSPVALEAAFFLHYPELRGKQVRFFLYNPWLGPLSYDGKTLLYESGLTLADDATEVFIWRAGAKEFFRASQPLIVLQNLRWRWAKPPGP